MALVAQKYQNELSAIKDNISSSENYFRRNVKTWHKSKKFLYVSTLDDKARGILRELKKPPITFNILESYVSRQKGEFAKQEPSVKVSAANEIKNPIDIGTIKVVEGYYRHIERAAREDSTAGRIYDDLLSGGYSIAKVYTDYKNERSFDQKIIVERVYDPTMCGFDILAEKPHKGDGDYCYQKFPMRLNDFKNKHPEIDVSKIRFVKDSGKFNWSYQNEKQDKILVVVEYFKKKYKKAKLLKLSDNNTIFESEYEEYMQKWTMSEQIGQMPQVVEERQTTINEIYRYRCIEDQVIQVKKTNYKHLPLVFIDGDSVKVRENESSDSSVIGQTQSSEEDYMIGNIKQYTRPYCYQAFGIQQLKDVAGQTAANELENMVQHKFMLPIEGIPAQYIKAYTDVQTPNNIIYHQFMDKDPDKRLDRPQAVPRIPMPPEVMQVFASSDQTTQTILGSYDAALGINKNQLSGIAIQEGATQSNAAAMPYITGYLNGLNRVATIVLDLIPKYLTTPQTIPIIDKDGERKFIQVNGAGQPSLKYDSGALNVAVTPGVNFSIQKSRAMQEIIALAQASPLFSQIINGPGLPVLLDNLEIRGADQLKEISEEFMKEMKQKQAQQGQQPNPEMLKLGIEKQRVQEQTIRDVRKDKIEAAKVAVMNKNADTNQVKVLGEHLNKQQRVEIEEDKINAENTRSAVDVAVKAADMSHKHTKDVLEMGGKLAKKMETTPNEQQ